jgi:hypothetical protein
MLPVVGLLLLTAGNLDAQRKLWGGLAWPQPAEELPTGRAAVVWPERVAKKPGTQSTLVPEGDKGFAIVGGWELTDGGNAKGADIHRSGLDTSTWFDAVVPGTVLTTLVEQGVYPDPYFGLNNLSIPDSLARTDWWYRTEFTPAAAREGERTWLIFDGINYKAEVFVNGKEAGRIAGAFIRGRFDVTGIIHPGERNVLAVHILPPDNPGIPHEQTMKAGQGLNGGALSLDGPTFISSVGWDWIPGIRDRNIGIWQPVRLVTTRDVTMGDPLVMTDLPLPDTTAVKLCVAVPLRNNSNRQVEGEIAVTVAGGVDITIPYSLTAGQEAEFAVCTRMENPRLWWPNGYGSPELYTAEFVVRQGGTISDRRNVRFGVRELSYEMMVALPDGSHRRVLHTPTDDETGTPAFDYVDRVKFGGQIVLPTLAGVKDMSQVAGHMASHGLTELPADDPVGPYFAVRINGQRVFCRGGNWGMDDGMKRVSRERLEPYVRLHREAGFNTIRNWTGESTEEDFYALCDEYGIMVWNDFWITTDDTVEPLDVDLFMDNARDAVRRFRNHPSITVWCPRNEGFAPANLELKLPAMMATGDPSRHYHGQSRYLNMDSSGTWNYFDDPSVYYSKNAKGFITEIGSFAVPTAASIRKFLAPEDRWPMNDVWAYHDMHHTSQNFAGFIKAVERYGKPDSMEDFERKAQLVCYDAWRAIMESWNSRMWNSTTGQIVWMSHPAWPSFIWQTYTWDYQTPGSYFGARKAAEPLHVQFNLDDRTVMVVNNTRSDRPGLAVRRQHIDPRWGRVIASSTDSVDAPAAGVVRVGEAVGDIDGLPPLHILRVELLEGDRVVSVNDYWRAADDQAYMAINEITPARLKIWRAGRVITVKNRSSVPAINVKLDAVDPATGEIVLPAYFSDGYFNLLPGETRQIEVSIPGEKAGCVITATGYNVF